MDCPSDSIVPRVPSSATTYGEPWLFFCEPRCEPVNCEPIFLSIGASVKKTSGRRAIGIALRPQHFIRGVLGKNRCHGSGHRATLRSLPSLCRPSRRSAVFAVLKHRDFNAQGRSSILSRMRRTSSFAIKIPLPPWATPSCRI